MKYQISHYCSCCVASDTIYDDVETALKAAKKLAKTVATHLRVCVVADRLRLSDPRIELVRVTSEGVVKFWGCVVHADCLGNRELAEACHQKRIEALS